ncbi:MAG: carotenoid biosynthesis protein [Rhodocyclaceae bacterium]|nr:carotenoid biosynthesis protein [Rhodocyclaceae bacterium]
MTSLNPSDGFIALQAANYLLTLVLLVHVWRHDRKLFWVMPAAIAYGYLIEFSQVSKAAAPYHYTQALVALPGPVPLGVVLSWGTILYAVLATVRALDVRPWLAPIVAALLAAALDFVSDPAFVSLGFWVWELPGAWFGIPWTNYVGWFVIVACFTAWLGLLQRYGPNATWFQAAAPWFAIPLAFGCFVAVMLGYLWLESRAFVDDTVLVATLFGLALLPVLARLRQFAGNRPLSLASLAAPLFIYGASLLILFAGDLHRQTPELAIVLPGFTLLGMAGFLWAYRFGPGLRRIGDVVASGIQLSRRALAGLLLAAGLAGAAAVALVPDKGLIGPVDLPADDAFLPSQDVQWWYWTGHLETEEGRKFGFEVVFFTFDSFLFMRDQLTQVAITDVENDSFHFAEHLKFHLPASTRNRFELAAGPGDIIRAVGDNARDHLHSEVGGYVLDLELEASKPVAMHYGGDAHPYRFGGYTYYYSRVNMKTRGTITVDGKTYTVSGSSWFDRQYGELYQAIVKGWQWFAIELDDGRQMMLYDILGKANEVERSGSITDAQGRTRPLAGHEFAVEVLGQWKSPHTGCTYPSGWRVTVNGEVFDVQPMVRDQELRAKHGFWAGPEYWEGASSVSGAVGGRAYVELNGFCRGVEGTLGRS